jgi:hypothetical protein
VVTLVNLSVRGVLTDLRAEAIQVDRACESAMVAHATFLEYLSSSYETPQKHVILLFT